MVKHSLDALVRADANLARQVLGEDDSVDTLRDEVSEAVRAQLAAHPEETDIWLKVASYRGILSDSPTWPRTLPKK